jgi:hypothetical protein
LDGAYISAFVGLVGVTLGGLLSFSTSWMTQRAQTREKHRESWRTKRESLFSDFIVEASRLYGDALTHEKDDVRDLVQLYALIAKMRLITSRDVVNAAEEAMDAIVATYLAPNRSLHEIRILAENGGMNFLLNFGEACRAELAASNEPSRRSEVDRHR